MNNIQVIGINQNSWTSTGRFGIGILDSLHREYVELLAPVFHGKYTADTYAAWYPTAGLDITREEELAAAVELELFISSWNDRNELDDGTFTTPDGQYPTPRQMALWFAHHWTLRSQAKFVERCNTHSESRARNADCPKHKKESA